MKRKKQFSNSLGLIAEESSIHENQDFVLRAFVDIVMSIAEKKFRLDQQLKDHPKGFYSEEKWNCIVCNKFVSGEDSWYDKYGMKCKYCQSAFDKRIIPISVLKQKESLYSKIELEMYFNLKGALLKKLIQEGILVCRTIQNERLKPYLQLFLISDNKDLLPPKKLLKGRIGKIEKNGEEFFTDEFWYECADEKLIRKLMKYRIVGILTHTLKQPSNTGRLMWKEMNPLFTYK